MFLSQSFTLVLLTKHSKGKIFYRATGPQEFRDHPGRVKIGLQDLEGGYCSSSFFKIDSLIVFFQHSNMYPQHQINQNHNCFVVIFKVFVMLYFS